MKLVPRYTPPGDGASSSSTSAPYGQSTTDSSSPPVPVYPISSRSYPDPSPTTPPWSSYTPYLAPTSTSTYSDFPISSPSDSPPPPSTTRSGPAAVTETTLHTVSTSNVYLNTSSFSTILISTATSQSSNISATTNRTAIIASLAAGLSALLLLLLVAFLLYKRRRRRRDQRLEPRIDSRALPQSALLHDDEMTRNAPTVMAQYRQNNDAGGAAAVYPSLGILRTRVSESGSIFREEVWPPPSPTIDPIQMRSSQVDLSRIVDDVMGPANNENSNPISETRKGHKRELTASSTTPLMVERQTSQTSSGHGSSEENFPYVYATPLSSSPTSPISPISPTSLPIMDQPNLRPYGLGLEAFPPVLQASQSQGYNASSSVTSISSSLHSTPGPTNTQQSPSFRPPSVQGSIASSLQRTQPKVSSPLVRLTGDKNFRPWE